MYSVSGTPLAVSRLQTTAASTAKPPAETNAAEVNFDLDMSEDMFADDATTTNSKPVPKVC